MYWLAAPLVVLLLLGAASRGRARGPTPGAGLPDVVMLLWAWSGGRWVIADVLDTLPAAQAKAATLPGIPLNETRIETVRPDLWAYAVVGGASNLIAVIHQSEATALTVLKDLRESGLLPDATIRLVAVPRSILTGTRI